MPPVVKSIEQQQNEKFLLICMARERATSIIKEFTDTNIA